MKKLILILCAILIVFVLGCQRGDIKISPIVQDQPSPHQGYNIGPELYLHPGDPAKVTGAVIWMKGLDPNNLFTEAN